MSTLNAFVNINDNDTNNLSPYASWHEVCDYYAEILTCS